MEDSHSQQQQPPHVWPMTIDGAEEDQILSNSSVLTRREVLTRRLRRVKQLTRSYRRHYWALMGEVKTKYREYCWTYGKSPFKDDEENLNGAVLGETGNGTENNEDFIRCGYSGCKSKAMALTRFCHTHILSDSKQKLYRGCTAVAKKSVFYFFNLMFCVFGVIRLFRCW
jgi:KAT8 regulatory NSL complex subunit 2